ncbi:MAG: hypothetical protein EOO02_06485 [Chitinophagaceae bacterium]|nr:MAG: hypothetical protein EOO02_06485 [Chitinophagaceae bacterium]
MKRRIFGTLSEMNSIRGKLFLWMLIAVSAFFANGCKEEKKGLNPLMADLDAADSAEILYFRSPDSARFFTYLPTRDKVFLGEVISNLKQDTVPPITCMKEGKIYLFKNGNLFHFALSSSLQATLEKLKSEAKEPAAVERAPAAN